MTLSINLSVLGLFFMLDWTDFHDKYHRENVWSNTTALFFPSVSAVKNPPAVQEMQVQSLGWENPLRRKWQPAERFLPGKSHEQRSLAGYNPYGHKRVGHDWAAKNNNNYNNCLWLFRVKQQTRHDSSYIVKQYTNVIIVFIIIFKIRILFILEYLFVKAILLKCIIRGYW